MLTKEKKKILVVPLETGGGKSIAIIKKMVNMLKKDLKNAGTIIVKERVADCEATAGEINNRIGWRAAISYCPSLFHGNHTSEKALIKELDRTPIMIITHQLLQKRLKDLNVFTDWAMPYNDIVNKRNMMIIDEQPQLLKIQQIDINSLNYIKNLILESANENLIQELFEVTMYIEMRSFAKQINLNDNVRWDKYEHTFSDGIDAYLAHDKVYEVLKTFCTDGGIVSYSSNMNYKNIAIYKNIDLFSLDYDLTILDGTAHINKIYKSDMFKIIDMPIRKKYGNVQVDVCRQFSGTKAELQGDTRLLDALYKYVIAMVGDAPTLIITLKEIEGYFKRLVEVSKRKNIMVNHWGNIKGSNDYRHCTRLFILGFMFLPNAIYKMTYHRFFGEDKTKSQIELPQYGCLHFEDNDYNAMKTSMVATEIVQGINRICCREPADKDGEAPGAYIFMLNKNPTFEEAIAKVMPGVKITTNTSFFNGLNFATKRKYKRVRIDVLLEILRNHKVYFTSDVIHKWEVFEADKEVLSNLNGSQRSKLWRHPSIAQLVDMGRIKIWHNKIQFFDENCRA